jgi:hypothetical protein
MITGIPASRKGLAMFSERGYRWCNPGPSHDPWVRCYAQKLIEHSPRGVPCIRLRALALQSAATRERRRVRTFNLGNGAEGRALYFGLVFAIAVAMPEREHSGGMRAVRRRIPAGRSAFERSRYCGADQLHGAVPFCGAGSIPIDADREDRPPTAQRGAGKVA